MAVLSLLSLRGWAQMSYEVTGPVADQTPFLRTVSNSTTSGSTIILNYNAGSGASNNVWSAPIAMPFSFSFFEVPVTHFCVSKNGLLTFDTAVKNTTVNALLDTNRSLPYSTLPDKTVAYSWGDFKTLSSGDVIRTYEIGTAPNRQFYVYTYSLTMDGFSFIYNFCMFEESTNKIYFIDAYSSGSGSLTMGVQKNSTTAYQVSGSPNIDAISPAGSGTDDDDYYLFAPEYANDASIAALDTPGSGVCAVSPLVVKVRNAGRNTLTSATIKYQINAGSISSYSWSGSIASKATLSVNIGSPTISGGDVLKVWTENPNGITDSITSNDTISKTIYQPLNGTFTLGGGSADYPTFDSARMDLELRGVCGPVRFNINAGTYNEQVSFGEIAGVSSSNTVTFNGAGAASLSFSPTVSADRHVLRLNGTDYFTFKNMNIIVDTATATYGWAVHLTNGANNNTFDSCNIKTVYTSTSSNYMGVVASGSNTSNTTATDISNLTISNCTVQGGDNPIRLNGSLSTSSGNKIMDNIIIDGYSEQIYLDDVDNTTVKGNDISRPNRPQTLTTFYGIYNTGTENSLIEANRIHDPYTQDVTDASAAYAIYHTGDASTGNENRVINNLIYDIKCEGSIYALYNSSSDGVYYYHNTVSLDDVNATGGTTRGVYQTSTASNIEIKNNIFSITRGGSGTKHGLYFASTTSTIASNNNVIYLNSAGSGSQYIGRYSSDQATLADWQAVNSSAYDQNSFDVSPRFKNPSLADFKPRAAAFNDSAAVISGITTDILGVSRGSFPDPGAYEFTPPPDDAGINALVSPNAACAGSVSVIATIRNYGSVTLDSVKVSWSLDGVFQSTTLFTDSILSANEANINLGSITVSTTPQTVKVWTSDPNGENDLSPGNDTLEVTGIVAALNGTYTVGTGKDYTTIQDAMTDLSAKGICGPVTFNVDNGTYTEQVSVGEIVGASSVNTITFNGNGATLIYGATSSSDRHVLKLDGTDYMTISNMNIMLDTSAAPSYGWTVMLMNGANNNTFSNCKIFSEYTSTSSNYIGLLATGSTTSNSTSTEINNLLVQNCEIQGGYYGIRLNGNLSSAYNNRIIGNTIIDAYQYMIYMDDLDSATVKGNDISRPNRPQTITTFYGIYNNGVQNTLLEGNKIHDPHAQDVTDNSSAYAIYHTGDAPVGKENRVVNNLIYNFNTTGTIYALYNSSANGVHYYYNTVVLDDANGGGTTRGVYQTSTASDIEFKNNIFYINRGSGTQHGLYFNTSTSTITSEYNDIYVGGTGNYIGRWSSTDYSDLAGWKSGTTFGTGSVDVNPSFEDRAANNLKPLSVKINNKGIPVAGVTTDFDGVTRNTNNPDIGAYEFNPSQKDVRVSALLSPAGGGCGDSAISVQVVIENLGLDDQYTIPVKVEVTGSTNASLSSIYNDTLLSGETTTYTLTGTVDTRTGGIFNVKAYTALGGDQRSSNDTLATSVQYDTIPGAPITTSYERCGAGVVALGASGTGTLSWFNSPTSTTVITTGASYNPTLFNTATYYVEAKTQNSGSITTNFTGSTTFAGNFFDIAAKSNLTLDSFEINTTGTGSITVEVYYKTGTYVGSENTASAWTKLGNSIVTTGNGTGTPTLIVPSSTATLSSGQTYGIFIIVTNGGSVVYNTGANTFDNNDLTLTTGASINGLFTGGISSPRTWNGKIYYSAEGCPSPRTPVSGTIHTQPSNNVSLSGSSTFCDGENLELQSDDEAGINYSWTLNGDSISGANSASYTAFVSGVYKMFATSSVGGCMDSSAPITVTVNDNPDATISASGMEQICDGDSLVISANSGTGLTYQWIDANGDISGEENIDYSAKATGTYKVRVTNAANCSTESDTVMVNNNALPTAINGTGGNGCEGTDILLTSNPAGLTSMWYDAMTGGNLLASTDNYTVPAAAANGSVYLAVNDGLCESVRTAVNYTVDPAPAPAAPTALGDSICDGNASNLMATASGGAAIEWFDAATDGNSLATGANLNTGALSSNTSFYAESDLSGCKSLTRTEVQVIVNAYPNAPAAIDTSACAGSEFTTTATANIGNIAWFNDSLGTSPVTTGGMLTGTITATDTFWVSANNEGCISASTPVIITAIALPTTPTAADEAVCEGEQATLTATSNAAIEWFDQAVGGNSIGSGNSLILPAVNSNTIVYAEANDGVCISERAAVIVIANPIPSADFTVLSTQGARIKFGVNNPIAGVVYAWDFGDGKIGTGATIYHDYTSNGTVTVTVTATNPITLCESTADDDLDMQTVGVVVIGDVALNYTVYPNPYQGEATVSYDLNEGADVTLEVFDMAGRKVTTLTEGKQAAGNYTYNLNTNEAAGVSGVYFVRITVNGQVANIKVVDLGN